MVDSGEGGERVIAVHGPRRFLGELSVLLDQPAFFTARAVESGAVLQVPADRVRERVADDPAFGDLLLRAFLQRRSILIGLGAGLRILGSCYSTDTRRLLEFVARNRLPHRWLDLENDPAAERLLDAARRRARGDAGRPARERVAAQPEQRGARPRAAPLLAGAAARADRSGGGGRRPGRAGGRRLRRVRGAEHGGARGRGRGRASRHVGADRELPGLPVGPVGRRTGRARPNPGPEVRRPPHHPGRGHVAPAPRWPLRARNGAGLAGRRRAPSSSPPACSTAGCRCRVSTTSRARASSTPRPSSRRGCAPATRWRSSAAATRRARRRSSCHAGRRGYG